MTEPPIEPQSRSPGEPPIEPPSAPSPRASLPPPAPPVDGVTQATFCTTLVDEWVAAGVRHAVVAPGSRSTPLALALASRAELTVHVFHDERSAAFCALGIGRASGMPAVLLCTSGTAAANFHPAVIEAHQDEVPLIACTADRPPELRDVAAPQTIDQIGLYGGSVRWFVDPGVADDAMRGAWRSMASRAVLDACGPRPGPVHLNLPMRDPLVASPGPMPPARDGARDRAAVAASRAAANRAAVSRAVLDDGALRDVAAIVDRARGVIVAGAGAGHPDAVHALAAALGWPVFADSRSGCRIPAPTTVAAFDSLLRHDGFATDHRPDVVVRLGFAPASKVLETWLASSNAIEVQVHATPAWIDAGHRVAYRLVAEPSTLCRQLVARVRGASGTPWLARWRHGEERAQQALANALAAERAPTEPGVARTLAGALVDGAALVASSSMPVRDLEWFSEPRRGLVVHANRGANGIDGVMSTAIGVALADPARPVALLIGDLAFLHDTNALIGVTARNLRLTIVVVDNAGGGIFSFLPQRSLLDGDRFEQLFGTPSGVDLGALAAAHHLDVQRVDTVALLAETVRALADQPGVRVLIVHTDRDENVAVHHRLNAAVATALDRTQ